MKQLNSSTSFTLIELVIVITFILMFTGFSIGYYGQFTEQKKLENETKKIGTILNLARAKTISGDSSLCGFAPASSAKVTQYSLDVINGGKYALQPECLVGTPTPIFYLTDPHIAFPTPALSVVFSPLTGNTQCSYIYVKNTVIGGASGACRYVKITQTGLVTEDSCAACDTCPTTCP